MPVSSESVFQLLGEKGIYGLPDFLVGWKNPTISGHIFMGRERKVIKTICIYAPIGYYELHRVAQQEYKHVEGEDHCIY
jgi:hypothetical protein